MKKLLTTAMVLAMLMTMFCMAPAVTAAEAPTMNIEVVNVASGEDTVSATFTGVETARWVVWSVKADSTGEYIFIDEKTGSDAQTNGFTFVFGSTETAIKALVNFTAEAKIVNADGSKSTLVTPIIYRTYSEVQGYIRNMLAGTKTVSETKEILQFTLPAYYVSDVDATVVAALNVEYAAELANPYDPYDSSTWIDPMSFYSKLNEEVLIATINGRNASAIENLLNNYFGDVGLLEDDQEKEWYEGSAERSAITTKLATYTYASVADFTNQFKAFAFINKLSATDSTSIIDFLRLNNNMYVNYGTQTNAISGGTLTKLRFEDEPGDPAGVADSFDELATTDKRIEYAKKWLAIPYASLTELEERFAALLDEETGLASISDPQPQAPTVTITPSLSLGGAYVSKPTVSVGLEKPIVGEKALPFKDLDNVAWAKEAIEALYTEGVINGVDANQFLPNAEVKREEFVKIVINTFGLEGSGKASNFKDVDPNAWYAPYVNTAVELGLVNGVSATEFGVGENISRQDMAVLLYRIANKLGYEIKATGIKSISDIDSIADYAKEAVDTFYKAGIINGVSEGVFAGAQTATRAQAAKLCYELREAHK